MTFVFLLTACSGPMTLSYGSNTLTYDSGTWEEFENDTKGLGMKGSDSCWADLEGDFTMPLASEMDFLVPSTVGNLTMYIAPDETQARYAALEIGTDTLFIRIGYDQEAAPCLEAIEGLAAMN